MLNMSKNSDNLKSLSKREIKIISELEFSKKYYFTKEDIKHHFDSKNKINYAIHRLIIKKRIIKLNKSKYYLIPIKAKAIAMKATVISISLRNIVYIFFTNIRSFV